MSRVPEEATLANAALMTEGRYPSDGPVLANVPGTVAGMHSAWRQFGSKKVPWADLLAPAIRAAKDGYVVSEGLATTLTVEREHFCEVRVEQGAVLPQRRAAARRRHAPQSGPRVDARAGREGRR